MKADFFAFCANILVMKGMKHIGLLLVCIVLQIAMSQSFAQDKLDSLRRAVNTMPDDTAKLSNLKYICEFIYNVDSAGKYCAIMVDLAQRLNERKSLAYAYYYLSRYYIWIEDFEKAESANMESIYIWDEIGDKNQLALAYMNLAFIYYRQSRYSPAAENFYTSLAAFRELNDSAHITQVLQYLGEINISVNSYSHAEDYYSSANSIDSAINNVYGLIADNVGLGRVFLNRYKTQPYDSLTAKMLASAKFHFDTAFVMAQTVPNIMEMQQLHMYLAMVHVEEAMWCKGARRISHLDSCDMHCRLLFELREKYRMKFHRAGVLSIQAKSQLLRGCYGKALELIKEADADMSVGTHRRETKIDFYSVCRLFYEMRGDYKKADEYATQLNYALMESDSDEKIASFVQSSSQAEFREQMRKHKIEEYEAEQQYKAKVDRQRLMLSAIVLSLLAISVVILISNLRRKKLNLLLSKKNEMLDEKNIQLVSAKEELSVQNDLLNIANKNITDSIVYAKHIQEAVMPTDKIMQQIFGDCMVLFRPCNIVSGDFYWAIQVGRYKALAVADCTGHGVPGALMSMLGISMLNDIVANIDMNNKDLLASEILDLLRDNVKMALRQNDNESSLDGIDMALMLIDEERQLMRYAGAFRPLVMIHDGELNVIGADRMPIGIYSGSTKRFTNHDMSITSGDCFYAYSDGITDQFCGDEEYHKFGRQRLFDMLLANCQKPFAEQKAIYTDIIDKWRHENEQGTETQQTDDIVLVGIKI